MKTAHVSTSIKTWFKFVIHKGMFDENGDPMFDEHGVPMVVPGTARVAQDWVPNVFLTAGKEEIARRSDWSNYCQVGTSGQKPIPGDTALIAHLAGTSTVVSNTDNDGAQGAPPYYGWRRRTFRFAVGVTAGNVNEVALGWSVGPGSNISVRALTTLNDVPTTVVPQADEILDVLAEVRYYPMLGDVEGSVTLDGLTYTTITRASMVSSEPQHRSIGAQMGKSNAIDSFDFASYDGELGTITQNPSGAMKNDNLSEADLAYGGNNYYRDIQVDVAAAGWVHLPDGFRSTTITCRGGRFQTRYGRVGGGDEPVAKTALKTLMLTLRFSWAGWILDGAWTKQAPHASTTPTTGGWNTDVPEGLLRINWTDDDSADRQSIIDGPRDMMFHIQDQLDTEKWVQYTMVALTDPVEGTDWTEYTVTKTDTGPGGMPAVTSLCDIRATTP